MTEIEVASRAFMQAAERTNTLYPLSEKYMRLVDLLEDPEADVEQIEQELEHLAGEIQESAETLAGLVAWYEGLAALRKGEAKRMADSVAFYENRAKGLRGYVLRHMKQMGLERIDTGRFTLKVRSYPHVEVLEAMLIPSEFNRTKILVEPDKIAIRKQWKTTGEIVPGTDIVFNDQLEIS